MTVMPLAAVAAAVAATAWQALGLVLLGTALLAALVYAVLRWRARHEPASHDADDDLPPLLFRPPAGPPAARPPIVAPAAQVVARPQQTAPARQAPAPAAMPALPTATGPTATGPAAAPQPGPVGEAVEAGNVRFHRPPEGTLQLLPGRLEILAGSRRVEEVRFVRIPGRPAAITFGRGTGEPHTHVQLEAPTVSRLHARMSYEGGAWRITNLSGTNPVLVNGEPLPLDESAALPLEDGDEVQMGQVLFRFRAR